MTQFLLDIASYQHQPETDKPIDLVAAQAKGVSLVNIKTTEGTHYTFSAGRIYAETARKLDMGICTFHYLNREASGSAQADFAWKQILNLGGPQGIAHECDCETNATETIYRDYVKAIQDKFGRHILTYSGDWWWQARGWHGADLTPYYTAAPNAGYLGSYPGDASTHWHAGYGGWDYLAMMQYAVGPIAGVGGGKLSQSAIRDPRIWAALTGGSPIGKGNLMLDACKFGDVDVAGALLHPVRDLQTALIARGGNLSDVGGVDGKYGNGTKRELAKFSGDDGSVFGVEQLLKLLDAGKATGAPVLVAHTHSTPAAQSGPAIP